MCANISGGCDSAIAVNYRVRQVGSLYILVVMLASTATTWLGYGRYKGGHSNIIDSLLPLRVDEQRIFYTHIGFDWSSVCDALLQHFHPTSPPSSQLPLNPSLYKFSGYLSRSSSQQQHQGTVHLVHRLKHSFPHSLATLPCPQWCNRSVVIITVVIGFAAAVICGETFGGSPLSYGLAVIWEVCPQSFVDTQVNFPTLHDTYDQG